jgi:hypothetical protein
MEATTLATIIPDDYCKISAHDLLWLLGCARDMLKQDIQNQQEGPIRDAINFNLQRIEATIEQ